MASHLLFGYGSLISEESRAKTGQSGEALPVRVQGIQRAWNLVVPSAGLTALGACRHSEATCNGVVVPVQESELPKFDERELPFGYSRIELRPEQVVGLTRPLPEGIVWAYVTGHPGQPTIGHPIAQSYVDVVLTGCFGFGMDFARAFVLTTQGWQSPWVNDRGAPRYVRAMDHVPLAEHIDVLLQESVPTAFRQRREMF